MENLSDKIYLNYHDTLEKVSQLDENAGSVERLCNNELQDICCELNHCWTGDSAQQFQKKIYQLSSSLEEQARQLHYLAESLRKSAQRIYTIEKMGVELFRR